MRSSRSFLVGHSWRMKETRTGSAGVSPPAGGEAIRREARPTADVAKAVAYLSNTS